MVWDKDPYKILGVAQSATNDEIKAAYRNLARRLHPDANPSNQAAEALFQDVTHAYEILATPEKRRDYDDYIERLAEHDESTFSLELTKSKNAVTPLTEPQIVYVLANIEANVRSRPDDRSNANNNTRLNLTLVLDQSNSMNGTRIEKVKIAAHQIIDNLSDNDILSVVAFNDRAEHIINATRIDDKPTLKTKVSLINARGGTEIYNGLEAGVEECRVYLGPKMVNHVILLTDGHTFGDQEKCLQLADTAASEGIGISAMGLGHDWNDQFLDDLASRTGGTSDYINSAAAVVRFLNDHVRSLTNAFAERLMLSVVPNADFVLESAFKLSPNPQVLNTENGTIPLGSLQFGRPISLLLQLQLPPDMTKGSGPILRLSLVGDVLVNTHLTRYHELQDVELTVSSEPVREEPPAVILDALSKLTLYKLQERAQEALDSGDANEATRRLENLATRLLELGEEELANQALTEARRVAHTNDLSDRARKTLKYQTRHLINNGGKE